MRPSATKRPERPTDSILQILIIAAVSTHPAAGGAANPVGSSRTGQGSDRGAARPPVLTTLKAKRGRAAAGLRTSAAHARSEEIEIEDVGPVIELTGELIGVHLG
jgi:hypothetical protein